MLVTSKTTRLTVLVDIETETIRLAVSVKNSKRVKIIVFFVTIVEYCRT